MAKLMKAPSVQNARLQVDNVAACQLCINTDARRSVQATLILFISTNHESMQVNLKPRLDFTQEHKT